MICSNCGKELAEGTVFCDNCGTKQEVVSAGVPFSMPQPKKMGLSAILVIVAAALMILGTLIPCYTVSFFGMSESVSYIEGDGIFILIAAIAVAALVFFKKEKFACVPAGIAIIILINFSSELSKVGGLGSYGFGFYLMWIGSIAACVLPFIKLKK